MRRSIALFTVLMLALVAGTELLAQTPAASPAVRADGTPIWKGRTIPVRDKNWKANGVTFDAVKGATLWYSNDGGASWKPSNAAVQAGPARDPAPRFIFSAPQDGDTDFIVVNAGTPTPKPGEAPVAGQRIHFDSDPPKLGIVKPVGNEMVFRGSSIDIAYTASDMNLDLAHGFSLEYSSDSKVWVSVTSGEAVVNSYPWRPTVEEQLSVNLRVTVRDLAGNIAQSLVQNISIGVAPKAVEEGKLSVKVMAPKKIYFENTEFTYDVANPYAATNPGSATAYVAIWYTMDNGKTWKAGGATYSADHSGSCICYFPEGLRRNAGRTGYTFNGNYEDIGFLYQVVTRDGMCNVPDPVNGTTTPTEMIPVDQDGPRLHVTMPSLGDKLFRGAIPNNNDSGKYWLTWGGADMNPIPLVTTPGRERGSVSIWYTTTPDDPMPAWTMVADRLPLDKGTFVKTNDLPLGWIRMKVRAVDQMGNFSERETGRIEVIDGSGYQAPQRGAANMEVDRIWAGATQLYRDGKYADAVKMYDSALDIAPSDRADAVRHDRALAMDKDGRQTEAIAELVKLVDRNAENLRFRYSLGCMYYRTDKRADAMAQLNKITELDAKEPHIEARSMLATLEHQGGNTKRAMTLWKFIVEHGSATSEAYKNAKAQIERQESK
jgi:hypothetical protein